MASYLESYGAIEERKARNRRFIKRGAIGLVSTVIAALLLYGIFRNHSQERVLKTFLDHVRNHQYQEAYRMWGCSEQTPCRDYAFPKFMEDWGPASPHANDTNVKIAVSESCGSGVFLRLDYPNGDHVGMMVDRDTKAISFAPSDWLECPGRHWHFWEFFKSLFRR